MCLTPVSHRSAAYCGSLIAVVLITFVPSLSQVPKAGQSFPTQDNPRIVITNPSTVSILEEADCRTATASGSTFVGSLEINGKTSPIYNTPETIDLVLAKIYLNQQVKTGNTIIERAMFIDLPGTTNDIAIGQSIAGENCTG